jgi:hypothetical protein
METQNNSFLPALIIRPISVTEIEKKKKNIVTLDRNFTPETMCAADVVGAAHVHKQYRFHICDSQNPVIQLLVRNMDCFVSTNYPGCDTQNSRKINNQKNPLNNKSL